MFALILQGIEDFLGIVFFDDGTRGADEAALPAKNTVGLFHGLVKGGGDTDIAAASGVGQRSDSLYVLAGSYTSAAADTFGWVADDGGIGFDTGFFFYYTGQVGF